jgi:hypothetical protein
MIAALVSLIVLIVVVGIVAYIVLLLLDMLPIEGGFKQIARVLIMLVAVLIVLMKALPLLGVSI